MELGPKTLIFGLINISFILVFLGIGIYVLTLIIKALKVYIKKNS